MATDGRSISKSWCRAPFTIVWQLRSCFCGAPSLTRGRVCLLYMLLVLANAVFLGSESLGSRDHILLSQFWDFPFRRLLPWGESCPLISLGWTTEKTPPPTVPLLLAYFHCVPVCLSPPSLLGNGLVARQQLSKHVSVTVDTQNRIIVGCTSFQSPCRIRSK
jgi:hypothetical protein